MGRSLSSSISAQQHFLKRAAVGPRPSARAQALGRDLIKKHATGHQRPQADVNDRQTFVKEQMRAFGRYCHLCELSAKSQPSIEWDTGDVNIQHWICADKDEYAVAEEVRVNLLSRVKAMGFDQCEVTSSLGEDPLSGQICAIWFIEASLDTAEDSKKEPLAERVVSKLSLKANYW
eukprot:CAMPEP_0169118306 /NCGR_PEP_ID=MMETSP1015-20121227/30927_1 /TAXON_ID=342587 /ORGANISM="Karlodinium micrum, Strain CCMP2283" /LENGTH=175 /DNA_ID=CAMNT_0009181059 /DNA_START=67 /DNA_END=591 /DNA_ORIENTATION=+